MVDKEITDLQKDIFSLQEQKRLSPDLIPIFIDKDIQRFEDLLSIKKTNREHLLEQRKEGFSNKIFWNLIIPLITSIITTIITIRVLQ